MRCVFVVVEFNIAFYISAILKHCIQVCFCILIQSDGDIALLRGIRGDDNHAAVAIIVAADKAGDDCRILCTRCIIGRQELTVITVENAVLNRPCHGDLCIFGNLCAINEVVQICRIRIRFVYIAPQDRCELLTGDLIIRREGRCGSTVDNTLCLCPSDGIGIPFIRRNILKGGRSIALGSTGHTVQNRNSHCTGHGRIRLELVRTGAVHQTSIADIVHIFMIPCIVSTVFELLIIASCSTETVNADSCLQIIGGQRVHIQRFFGSFFISIGIVVGIIDIIIHCNSAIEVLDIRIRIILQFYFKAILAGLFGIITQLLKRIGDISTVFKQVNCSSGIDQARALLTDRIEVAIQIRKDICGAFQQISCLLSTSGLIGHALFLQCLQNVCEGSRSVRASHGGAAVDFISVIRRIDGGIDISADGGDCRIDRQVGGSAPTGEITHLASQRILDDVQFGGNRQLIVAEESLYRVLRNGNCRDFKGLNRHGNHTGLIVDNDTADCTGIGCIFNLFFEADVTALDHSDLAGNVGRFKVFRITERNHFGIVCAGHNDVSNRVFAAEGCAPHGVLGRIRVRNMVFADINGIAGVSQVFNGSNGGVAFIGSRAADSAVVLILRSDIAHGGILSHGVVVTGRYAGNDAGIFQTLVDVAEFFGLKLRIKGEAVLSAEGHIDYVRTQLVSIFQSIEVNVGGSAFACVREDLHCENLSHRSAAFKRDSSVGVNDKTADGAGNVCAVTVMVCNIIVHVCIVICKRNLHTDIFAFCTGLGNILGSQGFGQIDTLVDLECLVGDTQTGIQNCNDHAAAVIASINRGCIAGHQICVCHLDVLCRFDRRNGIMVGNMYRLDTLDRSDLIQITVGDFACKAVKQRSVVIQKRVINTAHCTADLLVLTHQLSAVRNCSFAVSLCNVSLRSALKNYNGANELIIRIPVAVHAEESIALVALCVFLTVGRIASDLLTADIRLVCRKRSADA